MMFVSSSQFVNVISFADELTLQVLHNTLLEVFAVLVAISAFGASFLLCTTRHRRGKSAGQQMTPSPFLQSSEGTPTPSPSLAGTPTPDVAENPVQLSRAAKTRTSRRHVPDPGTKTEVVDVIQAKSTIPCEIVPSRGNLDDMVVQRKLDWEKQLDLMGSDHEMEEVQQNPKGHVTFQKTKCKLYETNDVLTRESRESTESQQGSADSSSKERPPPVKRDSSAVSPKDQSSDKETSQLAPDQPQRKDASGGAAGQLKENGKPGVEQDSDVNRSEILQSTAGTAANPASLIGRRPASPNVGVPASPHGKPPASPQGHPPNQAAGTPAPPKKAADQLAVKTEKRPKVDSKGRLLSEKAFKDDLDEGSVMLYR